MAVIINKSKGRDYGLDPDYLDTGVEQDKPLISKVRGVDISTLYDVAKKSPEVTAALFALVEDILSDGWKYEGAKSGSDEAEEFEMNSQLFKKLSNSIFDMLLTGNGYLLKLSINEERIKNLLERLSQKEVMKRFDLNKKDIKKQVFYELRQKNAFKPKDLQVLKSDTVNIKYDEHGKIVHYKQSVQNNTKIFSPEEIIHLTPMNLGGSVFGFNSVEPLLSDIATLIFAKNYAGNFFENNGVPNLIVNLPEAMGEEDRNYQVLQQALKEGKKKVNKWRALVTTGPTEVTQIEPFSKEMQFVDMIREFKQIVLMALGVPPQRVNPQEVKGSGQNELRAYEGYFKKINFLQKIIEGKLNKELFSHFGRIKFKFNRTYKIDELREANIVAILADRKLITVEQAREMMGMEKELGNGTPIETIGQDRDNRALQGQDTRKPETEELSEPKNRPNKPDNKVR